MISAHTRGHILTNVDTHPCYHLCKVLQVLPTVRVSGMTYILSLLTHLQPEMSIKSGQIPPNTVTLPLQTLESVSLSRGKEVYIESDNIL